MTGTFLTNGSQQQIVEVKEEDRSGKPAEPKKDDDDDDDNADHDCSAAGNGEKGAT